MSEQKSTSTAGVNDVAIAKIIGVSVATVRRDRREDREIPFTRYRGRIIYDPERVRAALIAREEGGIDAQPKKRKRAR